MRVVALRRAARAVAVAGVVLTGLMALAAQGRADEQRVKRFGIALYAMPTNMALDDLNSQIAGLNVFTAAQNLAPIDNIHWSAQFGLEGRYTVTHHWTAVAGFGTIKANSTLDLLPQVGQHILVQAKIKTVPVNLGAAYYFNPKTSGNVTLRPFLGAGLERLVETKVKIGGEAVLQDTTFSSFQRPQGEGIGWYGEGGMHFMFASKYSVILNGMYRHAKSRRVLEETTLAPVYNLDGTPYEIDPSGFGIRFALQIGLFGKPVQ
jgi:outer membrane protein W